MLLIEFVGTVNGLLAQWIEQQISNLSVPGSNPGEITKIGVKYVGYRCLSFW